MRVGLCRQYCHHWYSGGGLCGLLGVSAEESGGWDYGRDEEVLGACGGGREEGRMGGGMVVS